MKKIHYEFRPIEGVWRNISGDSEILANFLEREGIIIDDRTRYARIVDYEQECTFLYRHYDALRITIEKQYYNE